MNTSACQNCLSSKRQFYVYLWCSHVVCLNCCICLTNFQAMSIRCCYRNTQLSEQLQTILMQQAIRSKGDIGHISNSTTSKVNDNHHQVYQIDSIKENDENYKNNSHAYPQQKHYNRVNPHNQSVKIQRIQSFYLSQKQKQKIDQNKLIRKEYQQNQRLMSFKQESPKQLPSFGEIYPKNINNANTINNQKFTHFEHQYPYDYQKQTKLKSYLQKNNTQLSQSMDQRSFINEITNLELPKCRFLPKTNNVCWKNHETITDRISAKLNYHQQKMNCLLEKHYVK